MKRKLLNAALFGAVLIAAPVSTFVSCADYDSDLQNVNDRLDKEVKDLKDLVDQKETVINNQIKELDAQVKAVEEAYKKADADLKTQLEKAIKDGDAALQAQIEDCQTKCKAEFAAVRAELAAAKKELQDALAAAETKHGEDVAKLLEADTKLQEGINKANADLKKAEENLQSQINSLKGYTEGELQKVREEIEGVKTTINNVKDNLQSQINVINGKIEDLQKELAATKADLQDQITKNATDIATNKANLEKHIADFESHKTWAQGEFDKVTAELAKKATKEEVKQLEDALRALIQANANEISGLKGRMGTAEENIGKLQTAVAGLSVDVAKNTQAIVDNAARIVYLEGKISENATKLAALREEFEAYQVAQAAVDAAQDLALTNAVTELNTKINGVDSKLDTEIANRKAAVEKCYNDAVAKATELANLAEANAKAYTDLLANDLHTNYYTKTQIDALLQVINDDLDGIHEDLSLFHDDFNNFSIQTKAALFDINETLKNHDERLKTNASRIETVREELLDVTDDLYRECGAIRDLITLRVSELNERIDGVDNRIDAVEEAYKAADVALGERIDGLTTALNNFKAQVAQWNKELSSEVKGFVLEPASYYEGIQAIEGNRYELYKWNIDPTTGIATKVDAEHAWYYCPTVTASYHVNPSTAVLDTNVEHWGYNVLDRKNRVGNQHDLGVKVENVKQEGSMVDITLSLANSAANKTPQTHKDPSEVTVMALQYENPAAKDANQIVTSDYAVLYLNALEDVYLVTREDGTIDLKDDFTEFSATDNLVGKDEFQYDETYSILDHIGAKFDIEGKVYGDELPEGFEYRYTLLPGDQNKYFELDTKTGDVKAKPQTTVSVGKVANFRIDVVYNNDKVVEVGYYKLTITGKAQVDIHTTDVVDDRYSITCDPEENVLDRDYDLKKLWDHVAAELQIPVDECKDLYEVTVSEDGNVKQFSLYNEAEKYFISANPKLGVISLPADQKESIHWTIKDKEVKNAFRGIGQDKQTEVSTWIRVRSKDAITKDTYNEFYLKLTWKPEPLEVWNDPEEVIWNYEKVSNWWNEGQYYNPFTKAKDDEIRLYADLTTNGVAPITFDIPKFAMKNVSDSRHIQVDLVRHDYFKNADKFTYDGHFAFVEHPDANARVAVGTLDGVDQWYDLTVEDDPAAEKTYLVASIHINHNDPVRIAEMTYDGVVTLYNNERSELLLDRWNHKKLDFEGTFLGDENLGGSLAARVGYVVDYCAGDVKVVKGEFDVRFLRPLTIEPCTITMKDSEGIAGVITKSILDKVVAFNEFTLLEHPEYITSLGVTFEPTDKKTWKTNFGISADADCTNTLGALNIDELFGFDSDNGNITYKNATAVIDDFTVLVPVNLKYVWNRQIETEPTVITVKVERTKANSNRR